MRIKDKLKYKISCWTYGKKTINQKPAKVTRTLGDIDEIIGDAINSIKKKEKK